MKPYSEMPMCLCSGTDYEPVYVFTEPTKFEVARCTSCGLARTLPVPYENELNAEVYLEVPFEEVLQKEALWCSHFTPLLQTAQRYKITGHFLDVGCGVGLLVKMAAEAAFDAFGVEISRPAALYGKEKLGLKIVPTDLAAAGFPTGFFDVVTMSQVLEHIAHPKDLLGEIHRVLKPDGILIVESPNIAGWVASLLGSKWGGFQPQWHVWQFTPSSITACLKRFGFLPLEVTCHHNIYMGLPLHPFKRLLRLTVWRMLELASEAMNASDKVMIVAKPSNG